jgi:hypothetical protein
VIGMLRRWLAGFGDPAPNDGYLPDPVKVTVQLAQGERVEDYMALLDDKEPGWTLADVLPGRAAVGCRGLRVVITREDGMYRWRDDGFKGY